MIAHRIVFFNKRPLLNPKCEICHSTKHGKANCMYMAEYLENLEMPDEQVSDIIHWGYLHRLNKEVQWLYKMEFNEYWKKPEYMETQPERVDYFEIALAGVVEDLKQLMVTTEEIKKRTNECKAILSLHFSKAFPITFDKFCHRVARILNRQKKCQFEAIEKAGGRARKRTRIEAEGMAE